MAAAVLVSASGPARDAFRDLFDALPVGAVLFDPCPDGFLAFNDAARAPLDCFASRRSPEYLHLYGLSQDAVHEPHEAWIRRLHP